MWSICLQVLRTSVVSKYSPFKNIVVGLHLLKPPEFSMVYIWLKKREQKSLVLHVAEVLR